MDVSEIAVGALYRIRSTMPVLLKTVNSTKYEYADHLSVVVCIDTLDYRVNRYIHNGKHVCLIRVLSNKGIRYISTIVLESITGKTKYDKS